LQSKGAKRLILDLRYCAVGAPEDGIALANLFLDKGLIAYVQGQRWNRQDFKADAAKKISNLPLEVLVNRGTADGAEVAAAALQDDKRAELIGERTYGDASIRKAITMDDGGAIILSVAKYYSPNGKAIQGENAVTPGTLVAEAEAQPDTDDNGEPLNPDNENRKPNGDPILERAIKEREIKLPPLEVRPQ
jgi:carboxyl-terminal processing protease